MAKSKQKGNEKQNGDEFWQKLYLSLDRDSSLRTKDEAAEAMDRAGQAAAQSFEAAMSRGGKQAVTTLTNALNKRLDETMLKAKVSLGSGIIDQREFSQIERNANKAFNETLIPAMERLQSKGKITDAQFATLAGNIKEVGDGGQRIGRGDFVRGAAEDIAGRFGMGSIARGAAGGLPGLAASAGIALVGSAVERIVTDVTNATAALHELEAAEQRLEGASILTGQSLEFLRTTSAEVGSELGVAAPIAHDLTAAVGGLTQSADKVSLTGDAMRAFLDLGAAQGLNAADTLSAVEDAVKGIDAGTEKLLGKSPATIYAEYAAQVGKSADALTEQDKAQARLNATMAAWQDVQGERQEYMLSEQGALEQLTRRQQEYQVEIAEAWGPVRELTQAVGGGLTTAFSEVEIALGKTLGVLINLFRINFHLRVALWADALANAAEGGALFFEIGAKIMGLFSEKGADWANAQAQSMNNWVKEFRAKATESRSKVVETAQDIFSEDRRPQSTTRGRSLPSGSTTPPGGDNSGDRNKTPPRTSSPGRPPVVRQPQDGPDPLSAADLARLNRNLRPNEEPVQSILSTPEIRTDGAYRALKSADERAAANLLKQAEALSLALSYRTLTTEEIERGLQLESNLLKLLDSEVLAEETKAKLARTQLDLSAQLRNEASFNPENLMASIQAGFVSAADSTASHWTSTFGRIFEEAGTLREALDGMWEGYVAGLSEALRAEANQRAGKALIEAAEEGAKAIAAVATGRFGQAGGHALSAAKWTGVAAMWSAFGGGAAAMAHSKGGRTSTRDAGMSVARDAERPPAEIHIYPVVNALDPRDPRFAHTVYQAYGIGTELNGVDRRLAMGHR